jgi:hypothetical protein
VIAPELAAQDRDGLAPIAKGHEDRAVDRHGDKHPPRTGWFPIAETGDVKSPLRALSRKTTYLRGSCGHREVT